VVVNFWRREDVVVAEIFGFKYPTIAPDGRRPARNSRWRSPHNKNPKIPFFVILACWILEGGLAMGNPKISFWV